MDASNFGVKTFFLIDVDHISCCSKWTFF